MHEAHQLLLKKQQQQSTAEVYIYDSIIMHATLSRFARTLVGGLSAYNVDVANAAVQLLLAAWKAPTPSGDKAKAAARSEQYKAIVTFLNTAIRTPEIETELGEPSLILLGLNRSSKRLTSAHANQVQMDY